MRWKNRATRWEWSPGVWSKGPPYDCIQTKICKRPGAAPGFIANPVGVGGRRHRRRRRAAERLEQALHDLWNARFNAAVRARIEDDPGDIPF